MHYRVYHGCCVLSCIIGYDRACLIVLQCIAHLMYVVYCHVYHAYRALSSESCALVYIVLIVLSRISCIVMDIVHCHVYRVLLRISRLACIILCYRVTFHPLREREARPYPRLGGSLGHRRPALTPRQACAACAQSGRFLLNFCPATLLECRSGKYVVYCHVYHVYRALSSESCSWPILAGL